MDPAKKGMITCGLLDQVVIVRKGSRALWDTSLLDLTVENINNTLFATLLNHSKPKVFLSFTVFYCFGL